jgi:PhzF family phenazine biosynthesis protein
MAKLRIFQIDAFTGRLFGGNPAAVVPLDDWLDDATLQAIANENNLSETAFLVPRNGDYALRWFTPIVEVKLCGHATLAAAFVVFTELEPSREAVAFQTLSGVLRVERDRARLRMSFPRWDLVPADPVPDALRQGLALTEADVHVVADSKDNYFVVLPSEERLRAVQPDFRLLRSLHPAGVIVTAPGTASDCVCRYFAPSYGIDEDPATGSIHCALAPYWAARLGKADIHSRQLSSRGAELFCESRADATLICGEAVKYLEGQISV